jgi:hypothetical protein
VLGTKLKDKIRNEDIRSKTKVTDILKRDDQLIWRWTGHLIRRSQEKWSKQVACWYPRDRKRKRGRPNRRCKDEIRNTLGPLWTRVALDRTQWRQMEEAFANRHSEVRDIL